MAFPESSPVSAGDTGRITQYNNLRDDVLDLEDRKVEKESGVIQMYGGSAAPTGWLLCDGSAVSRATYADLFAVISTKYGAGDSSTTFNVPNLKGRVPVGLDSTITDFNDRGKTGGEKEHTLTVDEMPSHNHTISNIGDGSSASGSGGNRVLQTGTLTTNNTGGGTAHENMPPYVIVNYIIKT